MTNIASPDGKVTRYQVPEEVLKLPVEIFYSLQGEGLNSGRPAVFVRFAKCNFKENLTTLEIEARIKEVWWESVEKSNFQVVQQPIVVLTGEEPLCYDLKELVVDLQLNGYEIQIETNGTEDPIFYRAYNTSPGRLLDASQDSMIFYTVSPKADADYNIKCSLEPFIGELKYVVDEDFDLRVVPMTLLPITLQPESNKPEMIEKTIKIIKENLSRHWRLGLQLHKIVRLV